MRFKLHAILLVTTLFFIPLDYVQATPVTTSTKEYASVDSVSNYQVAVGDFKENVTNAMSELRTVLSQKKNPQAHFVKNAQSQIENFKFNSEIDFKISRELLLSLKEGTSSAQLIDSLGKLENHFKSIVVGTTHTGTAKEMTATETFARDTKSTTVSKVDVMMKVLSIFGELFNAIGGMLGRFVNNNLNLFSGISLFVMALTSLHYIFKSSSLQSKNKKLISKDWSNLVNIKAKKGIQASLDSIDTLCILQIDSNDNVIFSNLAFNRILGKCVNWNTFFMDNFKSDKNLRGVANVYRFKGDIACDYFINFGKRDEQGKRTIFLHQFDSVMLAKVAENRKAILEKNKVSALDLLEDTISHANSFKTNSNINLAESDYMENLCIYIPEDQARLFFDHYVRLVSAVARLKGCQSNIEIKSSRVDKKFHITAHIPGINIHAKDLSVSIPFGGQNVDLGSAMKEISTMMKGYETSVVIKNVESVYKNGIVFEVVLADIDRIKTESFEYSL